MNIPGCKFYTFVILGFMLVFLSACKADQYKNQPDKYNIHEIILKKELSKGEIQHLIKYKARCPPEDPLLYLENSASPYQDSRFTTGLLVASANGLEEFVQWHINNGSDVNAKNRHGVSPLHVACTAKTVKMLLDAGADINARDKKGKTPLISMASSPFERSKPAEVLIQEGAGINDADQKGWTALMYTVIGQKARLGNNDIQHLLLKSGADFKKTNNKGQTAFELAVLAGEMEQLKIMYNFPGVKKSLSKKHYDKALIQLVKSYAVNKRRIDFLLNKGADVNAIDKNGKSVLYHALKHNITPVLLYLKSKGAVYDKSADCRLTSLHILVMDGDYNTRNEWISRSSESNHRDTLRYLAMAEDYLKKNRNNIAQPGCISPLSIAAKRRLPSFVKLILRYGANVNFRDRRGYSPLHLSFARHEESWYMFDLTILKYTFQTVKTLIDGGADINSKAKNGNTPLLQYVLYLHKSGYIDYLKRKDDPHSEELISNILSLLLDSGADVNTSNNEKQTALMLLARTGNAKLVKMLLHAGADSSLKDKREKTALDYAKQNKNDESVQLLLE